MEPPDRRTIRSARGIPVIPSSLACHRVVAFMNESAEHVEYLSKLVRDGIRQLSNERKPITCETLSQVLASRDGIDRVLKDMERGGDGGTGYPGFPFPRNGEPARRASPERCNCGELGSDAGHVETLGFYKRAVLTLAFLMPGNGNPALSTALERFRTLVLNDADPALQQECLSDIQDTMVKDEEIEQDGFEAHSRFFGRMRDAFLEILIRFESISAGGAEHSSRLLDLRSRVSSSSPGDPDTLGDLGPDLVEFVKSCLDRAEEERMQISAFIKELRTGLLSMEDQFMSSLEDTRKSFHINAVFGRALQGQMNDIKTSVNLARTIEDTRDFVLTKISTISKAVACKRKQDEERFERADHELGRLQKSLQHMKEEIGRVEERSKALEQEVLLDELTGVHNRRAYDRRLKEELKRFHGIGRVFSLIIFDIDHFKRVNDRYGHHAGDACLREIINRIKPLLRQEDFLARYGGEEFALILGGTFGDGARNAAEKLRRMVERLCFVCRGKEIGVTISLGVTVVAPQDCKPEDIFSRADAALYRAKAEGRNRVCLA